MAGPRIPPRLTRAFREDRAALFIGAGASVAAGLPTWGQFVATLCADLDLDPSTDLSAAALLRIPQYYENRFDRRALLEKIDDITTTRRTSLVHRLMAELPCSLFYTTNFDELLEDALRGADRRPFATVTSEADARNFADHRGLQVRKLHGTITRPDTIVVTRADYAKFQASSHLMLAALRAHLAENSFVFVGYSLTDPDFAAIFDDVVLTMGDMRQTHYFCAPAITDLERQDLRLRGVDAIDLGEWSLTGDPTDGLERFLRELSAQTSDLTHVRQFFTGLVRGEEVPLIVSSRTHEVEQFVYIAECDLFVAQQVEHALGRLGCPARRVADQRALQNLQRFANQDLVLICSPFGNAFTRHALELMHHQYQGARYVFDEDPTHGRCLRSADGQRAGADNPVASERREAVAVEHALIARYPNPWDATKSLFVFAGLHAIGTHAIGTFLNDLTNYRHLSDERSPSELLLRITYREHDPYDYTYEVEPVL